MAYTKEQRAAYNRAYYQTNKEKIKAYQQANKEKLKAQNKSYRQANKEKIKAHRKKGAKDRGDLWDRCFIPCIKHPSRRCNRAQYTQGGRRNCRSCIENRGANQRYLSRESVKARRAEARRRRNARPEIREQTNARRRSTALAKRIRENRI